MMLYCARCLRENERNDWDANGAHVVVDGESLCAAHAFEILWPASNHQEAG